MTAGGREDEELDTVHLPGGAAAPVVGVLADDQVVLSPAGAAWMRAYEAGWPSVDDALRYA